ncbi:MAG TPA: SRPBCC domain-containing protein [Taishania sp.]|nr:SRPBCC domain-containing protein [Taishania sp.]
MKESPLESLVVSVKINKTISDVWNAWSNPELMPNWLVIYDNFEAKIIKFEFRTGGDSNYIMASKDGKLNYAYNSIISLIIPFEKIEYHLEDGRTAILSFSVTKHQTMVQMEFEPVAHQDVGAQLFAWQTILDNFKNYLERE